MTSTDESVEERTAFLELVAFIDPTAQLNVRRAALEYVAGVSAALDGSAGKFFEKHDFAVAKAICKLCEATSSDRTQTLAALTNFTSGSPSAADFVLTNSRCTELAFTACVTDVVYASVASRLLANVSRHFPDRVHHILKQRNVEYIDQLINTVASPDETKARFIGFLVVNLSTLPVIRQEITKSGSEGLRKIYATLATSPSAEMREIATDVLRNLAFDDGIHTRLLDESDEYLSAILAPLLDCGDALDDEEMAKLPVRLQYYEKERDTSETVRQKLVETLFQLCATKHGRETLRSKGVYAAMRELDKANEKAASKDETPDKRPKLLSSQQEHTLHALIGILIRYESEMDVDPELHSIRQLE